MSVTMDWTGEFPSALELQQFREESEHCITWIRSDTDVQWDVALSPWKSWIEELVRENNGTLKSIRIVSRKYAYHAIPLALIEYDRAILRLTHRITPFDRPEPIRDIFQVRVIQQMVRPSDLVNLIQQQLQAHLSLRAMTVVAEYCGHPKTVLS